MSDESRGRTVEKRDRPSHQTQTEGGKGDENLNEHNVEVQDFASLDPSTSNNEDSNTRNLSDDRLAAMRKGAMTSKKNAEDEVERRGNQDGGIHGQDPQQRFGERGHGPVSRDDGSRSELSASKNEPKLNSEKEEDVEGKGFGNGSHGPVLRKPMLGERGHGPVVRGGRVGARGRGGPGVSFMED
jgi:hypothetical protein